MAKRSVRKRTARSKSPPSQLQHSAELTPLAVAFREFNAARVRDEFVRTQPQVLIAVEEFETAKTVSQRVLDAKVCI